MPNILKTIYKSIKNTLSFNKRASKLSNSIDQSIVDNYVQLVDKLKIDKDAGLYHSAIAADFNNINYTGNSSGVELRLLQERENISNSLRADRVIDNYIASKERYMNKLIISDANSRETIVIIPVIYGSLDVSTMDGTYMVSIELMLENEYQYDKLTELNMVDDIHYSKSFLFQIENTDPFNDSRHKMLIEYIGEIYEVGEPVQFRTLLYNYNDLNLRIITTSDRRNIEYTDQPNDKIKDIWNDWDNN